MAEALMSMEGGTIAAAPQTTCAPPAAARGEQLFLPRKAVRPIHRNSDLTTKGLDMNVWTKMKDFLERAAWALEVQPIDFLEARVAELEQRVADLSGTVRDMDVHSARAADSRPVA